MPIRYVMFLLSLLSITSIVAGDDVAKKDPPAKKEEPAANDDKEASWKSLFNGKDLEGWKSTAFGGEGDVEVKDGVIILHPGTDMTGITFKGKVPKVNYELLVEAQRLEGLDFFAATTFPVGEGFASLIPGGWSGGVTGLSSINGMDASENETTKYRPYEDKTWYKFRIRVTEPKVQVWVDDKLQIDVERKDKKFTIRGEVALSKPLGLATWHTKGAIKTIKIRELKE